jgi:hypothetical protein
MVGVSGAAGSNPPWEPDANAATPYGNIVFYNAAGNEVTSGTNLSSPFAYAVAVTAADAGADKATVTFFNPQQGSSPGSWTGTYEAGPTTFSPATGLPNGTPADVAADAPTYPVAATSSADISTWLASNTPSTAVGYANTIEVRLTDAGPLGAGNSGGTYWDTDIGYNTTASAITVDGTTVPANGWAELFPIVSPSTTTLAASPASPQAPGTQVTLTATVTPSNAAGAVQFFDGSTALGSPVSVASGTAATSVTPTNGTHSFTAEFVPTLGDETSAGSSTATMVGGSTSNTVPYTISNVTVTGFSPSKLGQGASNVGVTVTGSGFVTGATVGAPGVTFSSVSVVSATTITAKASVASTAAVGAATVTVTDSQGSGTCTTCLAVVAGPKVTKFSPNRLGQGATGITVTVTGSGFVSGATVAAPGLTFSSVKVVSATSITAKANVASTAKAAAATVTVTNPSSSGSGAGSCANCLTIATGPKVTKFSPNRLGQGASGVSVTVTGSGFVTGAVVAAAGVSFSSVKVVNATTITAKASVSSTAKVAAVTVTVTDPATSGSGAGSCTNCLSISAAPKVTKFTPSKLARGQSNVSVTINGSGFVGGATISVSGVTFSSVSVVNSTTITAKATVSSSAKLGTATVTVVNGVNAGYGRGSGNVLTIT